MGEGRHGNKLNVGKVRKKKAKKNRDDGVSDCRP